MNPRTSRRRLPELAIGLLCAALVAGGAVQAVSASDDDDGTSSTPTPVATATATAPPTVTPTTAPAATPTAAPAATPTAAPTPRPTTPTQVYASLVAFATQERGLALRRAVRPQYVSGKAFEAALVRIGRATPRSQRVRRDAAYTARVSTLVALGVARSRKEVDQYYARATGAKGQRAAYDPRTGRLLVRGGSLTPSVQQAIVRELVRVLDAQRFPLRAPTSEEAARARAALAEGDAIRVATAWYGRQPLAVRQRIDREASPLYGDVAGSPDALSIYDAYPDLVGPDLVRRLLALGGQPRLDAAFRRPPTTTAQVRDPRLAAPKPVSVPAVPRGARRLEVGVLGELGLAILLQEYPAAPGTARGWRGDRYVTYAVGGQTCTLMQVRTGSRAQQRALVATARRVVGAAKPLGSTGVAVRGCTRK